MSRKLEDLLVRARTPPRRSPIHVSAIVSPAVYSQIACMRWMTEPVLRRDARGGQPAGADGSMTKLMWGRIDQELAALAVDLLGRSALERSMGAATWRRPARRPSPAAPPRSTSTSWPSTDSAYQGSPMPTDLETHPGPVEFDPFSDEYFNDPTEMYRRLRDEAPVYFNEQYGFYALSRFADVVAAHRDWQGRSRARTAIDLSTLSKDPRGDPGLGHDHHDGPARARPVARAGEPGVHAAGRRRRSSR